MAFRKKHLRLLLGTVVAVGLVVGTACGYLVYRSRQTIQILLSPPDALAATDVYSRWMTLLPGMPITPGAIERTLQKLEYKKATKSPEAPGQYGISDSILTVYLKGFRYPDSEYPAQMLRLTFEGDRLKTLENASGVKIDSWRIEPVRLARWAAVPAAERPRVRLSELPPYVPGAVVAVEDKRFYHHPGFDVVGIARAVWIDLRYGSMRQGASTISQQLARSVFLDTRRTLRRKVLEAALTLYLEMRFEKPQLLEMYLNQVYWGQEGGQALLGIEAASRAYFGKSARQLTIAESALLAGLLHSPNRLSPRIAAAAALDRRRRVLVLMSDQRVISPAARAAALREPLNLVPPKKRGGEAAYFLNMVRDDLEQRYSLDLLLSQGWKIFTTLDPLLQEYATAAVRRLPSLFPAAAKKDEVMPEGALVALDPATGGILAWVGGKDYASAPFDRARLASRQPGSAFKPFVYLSALQSRAATPITTLDDKPLTLKGADDETWTPQNYDRKFRGSVSFRDALIHSLNVPTVGLAQKLGWAAIAETARQAGILSTLRKDLSSALGSSELSVLELTSAYGTLASGGIRNEPYAIESITSTDGSAVETHVARPTRAFEPAPVFLLTQILQAVLDEGTARSSRSKGFLWPAAGKTGTSENFQDAWFVGYMPELVCGVWVGFDQPKSLGRSAAGLSLPIWVDFMKNAFSDRAPSQFTKPEGIVEKKIDPESGLLARSGCPVQRMESFLPGTDPTEDCPKHAGGIIGFFRRLTRGTTQQ